tara:strand:- start:208 stop:678 length:471 start_codon:yes stop_codon:yes gene_type:complete
MPECYAGIDPGYRQGGVALAQGSWSEVHDLPIFTEQGVDCVGLVDILRSVPISLCVIEKQSSRPKQGVASAFKIGMAYGQILSCLSVTKVPYRIVTPSKWKNAFNVPQDKDGARRLAQQLYPKQQQHLSRKKDEHRAEALLMAAYAEGLANAIQKM